jgi:glycosyltransferase involved in cell wall biosynthesis
MKIAIIGTRGIPNNYGGFEQFAEYLSVGLVNRGHEVFVYNSHNHPYKKNIWNGVNIIHCYDPEYLIGTPGQFIYDLNCIVSCRKYDVDIILQLGYTSSSIWNRMMPKKSILVTNMDGIEWKRSKFSPKVQRFLKYAEGLAVKYSNYFVSDSIGIQQYLEKEYKVESTYIPYGAEIMGVPNFDILNQYDLKLYDYDIVIARMEPENNIEMMLKGFLHSKKERDLVIIGSLETKFGQYLSNKYQDKKIKYLGFVSGLDTLNSLRYFSNLYFHGHSVGGTNPSLL